MSNLARKFRETVNRILLERKMSRSELARLSGIDQSSMATLLNGGREVRTDTIEKIMNALAIEVSLEVHEHEPVSN